MVAQRHTEAARSCFKCAYIGLRHWAGSSRASFQNFLESIHAAFGNEQPKLTWISWPRFVAVTCPVLRYRLTPQIKIKFDGCPLRSPIANSDMREAHNLGGLPEVEEPFSGLLVNGVGGRCVHPETQRNFHTESNQILRELTPPDEAVGEHPFVNQWIARHEHEMGLPGADGTYDWRNGPDGFFDEGQGI